MLILRTLKELKIVYNWENQVFSSFLVIERYQHYCWKFSYFPTPSSFYSGPLVLLNIIDFYQLNFEPAQYLPLAILNTNKDQMVLKDFAGFLFIQCLMK